VCVTTDLSEDALADQQQLIHSSRMERYYQC
jgi:hypothetical protein